MFEISKSFRFEASHRLTGLREGHKCANLHGHSYRFEVVCRGQTDARGFVIDYAEISEAVEPIVDTLDHSVIVDGNDTGLVAHARTLDTDVVEIGGQTSAENLARWLYEVINGRIGCLHRIDFYETRKTRVTYPVQ